MEDVVRLREGLLPAARLQQVFEPRKLTFRTVYVEPIEGVIKPSTLTA